MKGYCLLVMWLNLVQNSYTVPYLLKTEYTISQFVTVVAATMVTFPRLEVEGLEEKFCPSIDLELTVLPWLHGLAEADQDSEVHHRDGQVTGFRNFFQQTVTFSNETICGVSGVSENSGTARQPTTEIEQEPANSDNSQTTSLSLTVLLVCWLVHTWSTSDN